MTEKKQEENIKEFKCPHCGADKTKTASAMYAVKQIGVPESIQVMVMPMEKVALAGVSIRVKAFYMDICTECGTFYCTKIEESKAPVQMDPRAMQQQRR